MHISKTSGGFLILRPEHFSLAETLDCGQAFRWEKLGDGSWRGAAFDKELILRETEDTIFFKTASYDDFAMWVNYFDLERDYGEIQKNFSSDGHLKKAMDFCGGIRILRQDTWEALCSFIISQNNNIPRIKGIISRLCESFGKKIGDSLYSFPSAEILAKLTAEDLAGLRAGFRAKYIIDAAQKVKSGEVNLEKLSAVPIEEARQELMKIKGVGPKVAECTLLYGAGRLDAFPVDVWVKRLLGEFYPDGFPFEGSEFAGIAQQYLFHYRRFSPEFSE